MKIAVIGEGPRDIGEAGCGRRNLASGDVDDGALCILVRRLLGDRPFIQITGRRLVSLHGRGGLRRKVELSLREAGRSGSEGAALVVDNDRRPPSEKINDLRAGRQDAQVAIPVALGVAIQELEAWLLSDVQALRKGLQLPSDVVPTKDPESLLNPKQTMSDIASRSTSVEDLNQIARLCDLETLKKRCPQGFSPFADEVCRELSKKLLDRDEM